MESARYYRLQAQDHLKNRSTTFHSWCPAMRPYFLALSLRVGSPPTPRTPSLCNIQTLCKDLRGPLVGVDPVDKVANTSVNASIVCLRTSIAPRHNTLQHFRGVNNGAARISRARVLSTSSEAGAEHVVGDSIGSVLGAASGAGNDGDSDLPQVSRQSRAALSQEAPIKQCVSTGSAVVEPYYHFGLCGFGTSTHHPATVSWAPAAGSDA